MFSMQKVWYCTHILHMIRVTKIFSPTPSAFYAEQIAKKYIFVGVCRFLHVAFCQIDSRKQKAFRFRRFHLCYNIDKINSAQKPEFLRRKQWITQRKQQQVPRYFWRSTFISEE